MSATQLAAWVIGAATSLLLALAGAALVYLAAPGQRTRFGVTAGALGVLATITVGVGAGVATDSADDASAPAYVGRCGPGLYDNGGERYDGPVCVPWPTTGGAR